MYKINEIIVVEGVYDKIKLSRFIDAVIFVTNGFQIFSNKDKINTLKTLAQKSDIVLLTDSDAAGFKIRNYIKQQLPESNVKHAYIPNVKGKEKRKVKAGKEGLLGVEGIREDIILDALKKAGCTVNGCGSTPKEGKKITKAHLFADGLSGGDDSFFLRKRLCEELKLPARLSSNMLIDVLNRILTYEEYAELLKTIKNENNS